MTTTTTTVFTMPRDRETLVEQLYKDGHITFQEVLMLMNIPQASVTVTPLPEWQNPWITSYGSGDQSVTYPENL